MCILTLLNVLLSFRATISVLFTVKIFQMKKLKTFFFLYFIGTFSHGVQVFDVTSYQYLKELGMHFGVVHCLVAAPSGRFLFSASGDKSIQVKSIKLSPQKISYKIY